MQAPLSSLAARGLLRLEGARVVLPSPTMRDALYGALQPDERARLHRAYAELSARGVEFIDAPMDMPYGIDSSFRDPSGNNFRLTQLNTAWG